VCLRRSFRATLAGLGNLVDRRHDLSSRQVAHAALGLILEPAPQRLLAGLTT
jgi:hypothetical protein